MKEQRVFLISSCRVCPIMGHCATGLEHTRIVDDGPSTMCPLPSMTEFTENIFLIHKEDETLNLSLDSFTTPRYNYVLKD